MRLVIEIEMATIDSIIQLATFSAIVYWEYQHISKHTVRLGLCLPLLCKVRHKFYLPWMDGGSVGISFYVHK